MAEPHPTRPIVFFLWHNHPKENHDAYAAALRSACIKLNLDYRESTSNVPGSPVIIVEILNNIRQASIVVADITLSESGAPNANVLFELGYAVACHGLERVILILSKDPGKKLPFDLAQMRHKVFQLPNTGEKIAAELTEFIRVAVVTREKFFAELIDVFHPEQTVAPAAQFLFLSSDDNFVELYRSVFQNVVMINHLRGDATPEAIDIWYQMNGKPHPDHIYRFPKVLPLGINTWKLYQVTP